MAFASSFLLFPGLVLGAAGRGMYSTSVPDTPDEKVEYERPEFSNRSKTEVVQWWLLKNV